MSDFPRISTGAVLSRPNRTPNQARIAPRESDQWLRKIDLSIYESAGEKSTGLNLTPDKENQLQIVFQVRKTTTQSPNLLFARIFNLAPSTINKIIMFKQVQLSAGYRTGRYGVIFRGTVVQYRRGKENATDTYLEIMAGDGDNATGFDVVSAHWEADTPISQIVKDGLSQSKGDKNQPITLGHIDTAGYGDQKLLRGMSANMMLRDFMRRHTNGGNLDYFIEDGEHTVIPRKGYRPETVELTPSTGLVGMPEVTPEGIQIRCLLNPNLRLGGLVKVKTDLLSGTPFEPGSATQLDAQGNPIPTGDIRTNEAIWKQPLTSAFTSPTGTYKILLLNHNGETRGNPWYSDLVCVALNEAGGIIVSRDIPFNRSIASAE